MPENRGWYFGKDFKSPFMEEKEALWEKRRTAGKTTLADKTTTTTGDTGEYIYVDVNQSCPEGYDDAGVVEIGGLTAKCRGEYQRCIQEAKERQISTQECKDEYKACLETSPSKRRRCKKKGTGNGGDGGNGGNGGNGGEGCEGGYKLADEFAGGASSGKAIWTDTIIRPEHGWYRSGDWEGHIIWHPQWGFQRLEDVYEYIQGTKTLVKNESGACKKGYITKLINNEKWCCPSAVGDGGYPGLGEYKFPPELSELFKLLMGRGKEFLTMPYGYSEAEKEAMFGRGFEKLRGTEAGTRESLLNALSRQGMLGTSAAPQMLGNLAWQTQGGISDLMRDLFISGEEQRRKDLLDFTAGASELFRTGLGSEQLLEAMNVGRRGEFTQFLAMLMSLLGLFK